MPTPRSLVHTLYRHWDIIEHLVRLSRETPAFEREQALAVIRQNQPADDIEQHEAVLQQLVTVELLQWQPRTSSLQINGMVLEFVRNLTREHELGLSDVLRARVEAIQEASTALAQAMESGDRDQRRRSANQLAELFRQIMQQLEQDQSAILKLVEESKSATDSMPVQRRYQRVLDAYDRYVEPMIEMMDTGINGSFYHHLEQAEQVLDRAVTKLATEGGLYSQQRMMQQVAYQAKSLRSQSRQALKTCTETLLPLREEARRHSALASSVSLLLGRIRSKGINRVLRGDSLPTWQRERASRLALGSEVLTIMSEARRFQPIQVLFPDEEAEAATAEVELVDEAALLVHLRDALPVPDLLAWLCNHYGHYSDATLLRLYNDITRSEHWMIQTAANSASLELNTVRVRFHPHGILGHD